MYHGAINHGGQLLDAALRSEPSTYFGRTSGYGRVVREPAGCAAARRDHRAGRGRLAAYARQGDVFRFYEIDPQVATVAQHEFTFLGDSPARVEVVLGDGRLSLEREARPGLRSCSRSTPSRAIRFRCTF